MKNVSKSNLVQISNSSAITELGKYALDAVEKKTQAEQDIAISKLVFGGEE